MRAPDGEDEMAEEIVRLATRVAYENRWMRVREDAIRYPDGSEGIYGVVEKTDFVVVAPVWPDGTVHLVEQYRYPVGQRSLEFPQGAWEGATEADPETVARGELREETGLVAGRLTHAGHLFQATGYSRQAYHVYLAEDLSPGETALEHEEQGLVAHRMPLKAFLALVRDGTVKDAATVAALSLLHLKGLIRP